MPEMLVANKIGGFLQVQTLVSLYKSIPGYLMQRAMQSWIAGLNFLIFSLDRQG